MGQIKSYQDLDVWQRAVAFACKIYEITREFPNSEMYGLTNQMRRASVSIPSNIAEGHVRSKNDYVRFLTIARGSQAELDTQLEIAQRIGFLSQQDYETLTEVLSVIGKQLTTLTYRLSSKG